MAKVAPKLGEAGEKSPSVHYANWKEDILLQKQLHVLNRSEKSIVHRIKIDQKVLFKRFQDKLLRSKLSQARLWGDKEKERELRARNLQGLNTELGGEEKDYDFLRKLSYNPCTRTGPSGPCLTVRPKSSSAKPKSRKTARNQIDVIIDSVFASDGQPEVRRRNSVSEGMIIRNDQSNHRSKEVDSASLGIPPVVLLVRPSTTDGHPARNNVNSDFARVTTATGPIKPTRKERKTKNKVSPKNDEETLKVPSESKPNKDRKKSSSFFEEEERVNVVELRLKEMKSVSYESKIKAFCDTIEDFTMDGQAHADYYTTGLQKAAKETIRKIISVPGTPEDEYGRHLGNPEVRSLTFKPLNLDFSKKEHVSQDAYRPDLPTIVADSSDDYSDSDSDDD